MIDSSQLDVPQLLSARRATMVTRVPWAELAAELEEQGRPVYRRGRRTLVAQEDIAALVESWRQVPVAVAADRIGLAIDLVAAELGLMRRAHARKPRPKNDASRAVATAGSLDKNTSQAGKRCETARETST